MNIFRKFFAYLRLREAIRMADEALKTNGQRYYVMPHHGSGGKLIIMDRKNFRILKAKKYISSEARVSNLEGECFYCTPYRNGNGVLPKEDLHLKAQQYYLWVEHDRKLYKRKRS